MPAGGIKKVAWASNYVWASGSGTWTETTKFLMDGFDSGTTEPVTVEMGDQNQEQDGLRLTGGLNLTSTTVPAAGTRYWFKFVAFSGASVAIGGVNGCRVTSAKQGIKPLGGGPQSTKVTFSCTGATSSDVVEDAL